MTNSLITTSAMEFVASIDFQANTATGTIIDSESYTDATVTNLSYGANWKVDSTSKVSVCSNSAGTNSVSCSVETLTVQPTYVNGEGVYYLGLSRKNNT